MTAGVEHVRGQLAAHLVRARERTVALTDSVDDKDLVAQHSPIMSPLVWDLAHIGNQEELWLVRDVGGREPVRRDIDELYDAFKHGRADRPSLPLLGPDEARAYVSQVRDKAMDVLDSVKLSDRPLVDNGFAFAMIAQHEQQHCETMLATHQLRVGAAALAARPTPEHIGEVAGCDDEIIVPAGEFDMGTSADPWALDNERPAHRVFVESFAIDRFPVTNAQFCEFIAQGGYRRREFWSEAGWAHCVGAGLTAPQYWDKDGSGRWYRTVFGRTVPVRPNQPVVHISYYEAEAFAAWAGKRLPTEAEWEKAARFDPASGVSRRFPWGAAEPDSLTANLGQEFLEPADIASYPQGGSPLGVEQLIGDVWEWTSSDFHGYNGFRAFPYREYSEVFFGGDYKVLRGGSFATDSVACRTTFRNWDYPIRRQIFAGMRCARDVPPATVGKA